HTRCGGRVAAGTGGKARRGPRKSSFMTGPPAPADTASFHAPAAGKHFAPNLWPERPARLRAIYTTYYQVMADLARTLMRLFALALDQPETFFDEKIDRHISRLRVRNYPAPLTPPAAGPLRAGPHRAYGSLTILKPADRP